MKMSIDSETKPAKKTVVRRRPRTRSQSEAEAKEEKVYLIIFVKKYISKIKQIKVCSQEKNKDAFFP